jgi:methylase of polypeptide subunit release factors
LPNLTELYPEKYLYKRSDFTVFKASSDDDFNLLESLIIKHRFYDSNDVYLPQIDLDKRVTAAIVKALGAQSCIEMGCFSGPVLSLLADQGVAVCGVDISHLAFVLAHNNIRGELRYEIY